MSGRLIAYPGVFEAERPGWISGSAQQQVLEMAFIENDNRVEALATY